MNTRSTLVPGVDGVHADVVAEQRTTACADGSLISATRNRRPGRGGGESACRSDLICLRRCVPAMPAEPVFS
jgi:hypothetical protein